MNLDKWKEDVEKIYKRGRLDVEKVPALVKRCPVCHSLTLEFEPKTGRIYCNKCGFEEHIIMLN